MTDETVPQSTDEPAQTVPDEVAADEALPEPDAQAALAENLTPPPGDLDPGPGTEDGDTEASEDTTVEPEVAPHYAKRGVQTGPEHTQHSQHSAHHKGVV